MKTRLFLLIIAVSLLMLDSVPAVAWDVWTTSPWLTLVTRFIGGVYVQVNPIETWNEDGNPSRKPRSRSIPKEARVLALDVADASRLGLNAKEWADLVTLYHAAPFDKSLTDYFFADPSALPFIAQKVFTALSKFDPANYAYFQRRLAEFQTRLDSTVIVGRSLLFGSPVIYIGGNYKGMLTAAGCALIPIDEGRRRAWERGEELDGLRALLEDSAGKKALVLVDSSSSRKIRDSLKNNREVLYLERPALDQDLLLFFHGQYILLWNRLAAYRQPRGIIAHD